MKGCRCFRLTENGSRLQASTTGMSTYSSFPRKGASRSGLPGTRRRTLLWDGLRTGSECFFIPGARPMRTSTAFTPFLSMAARQIFCLCAKLALADLLEALSRRANHANLYRAFERPGAGESAAREFE